MPKYNNFDDFHDVDILESEKKKILRKICKHAAEIAWQNNSTAKTIDDLLYDASAGLYGGFESIARFFDSTCYNDWILLAKITTQLYLATILISSFVSSGWLS